MHVLDWPTDGRLELSGLRNEMEKVYLLADSKRDLKVRRDGHTVTVDVPKNPPDRIDTVLVMEIFGSLDIPKVVNE